MQEKPVEIIAPNSNYFPEKSELKEVDKEPVDEEKEIDDAVDDIGTKSELKGNQSKVLYIFIFILFILSLQKTNIHAMSCVTNSFHSLLSILSSITLPKVSSLIPHLFSLLG